MADVFSPEIRSRVMRSIRSRGNRSTEIRLASMLRSSGIRGWRRHLRIAGSIPDFAFPGARLAIFVDGCFWHGCPLHSHAPAGNRGYWIPKLAANRARDRAITARLRRSGWRVIRLWEHDLSDGCRTIRRMRAALAAPCMPIPGRRPREITPGASPGTGGGLQARDSIRVLRIFREGMSLRFHQIVESTGLPPARADHALHLLSAGLWIVPCTRQGDRSLSIVYTLGRRDSEHLATLGLPRESDHPRILPDRMLNRDCNARTCPHPRPRPQILRTQNATSR